MEKKEKNLNQCICFSPPPQCFRSYFSPEPARSEMLIVTIFMSISLAWIHVAHISLKDLISDFHLHHFMYRIGHEKWKKQLSKYQCSCPIWRQPFKKLNYYIIKVKTWSKGDTCILGKHNWYLTVCK